MTQCLVRFCTWISLISLLAGNTAAATDTPVIRVGGDHKFPPYEYLDNGKPTGFNIDLIRAVAEVMGFDIEIRLGPWGKTRQDLEQLKIDVITGMVFSDERDKLLDFSVPHTMISPGLFVRIDSPIQSFADIGGKEIIVEDADIMHDILKSQKETSTIVAVADSPEALRLLASGKHDGAFLASEVHRYYIAEKFAFGNLRMVRTDIPPQPYCFAVAEGNRPLLYKLDQGLLILKSTGKYQEIYDRWFGVYEREEWWQTIRYFVLALTLIVALFVLSLLWSWSLRRQVGKQTVELRTNEMELRKAHADLEQRVEERTAALARTNERLKAEIVEREKMSDALRESEEKFRAIIDAFDGQVYICSPDYTVEFMNKKLIERTGRDATGEPCYRVLHDRDSICPWCVNDRVRKGETVRWQMQSPKDNRWYYVVNTPIRHTDGSISKQAMILDITERIEAEEAKAKMETRNRQLQKAESLGRMTAAIAHHFNNKLHVIMGHMELAMQSLTPDGKSVENLTAALQAADKAAEVSRLMLTSLGQVNDKLEPLDLAETCRKRLPLIQAAMPEHVALTTDLHIPGPVIASNANQIQLILTNLIGNSWEAIGDNQGTIELAVKRVSPADISPVHRFPIDWQPDEKSYACLEVRDTGCGITENDIDEAFDPFFSTKFTGRGLGLPVVLGLVQANNGAVTVASEPGRGSVFRVFFPISPAEAAARPDKVADDREIEWSGSVLLVDDDKIVLIITGEMLSMLGFTVLTAGDGIEAVELFRQHQDQIRFVLSDFAMPRMNGLETLTALRQIDPAIPVILASGYSEEQVMDGTHHECPQAFLAKPYRLQDLKEAIRHSLADRQAGMREA
jgi:signal transduction histidine kinase/ABC-type amino acid transport substrate-binding protein/ActR/RegA family two-component response regulator